MSREYQIVGPKGNAALRRSLPTTNISEHSLSGVQGRMGRVTHWRDGAIAVRWAATAALETEKHFRKIIGHEELWILKAVLDEGPAPGEQDVNSSLDGAAKPVDEERVAA